MSVWATNVRTAATIKSGDNVAVTWTSTDATSCACSCENASGNKINCGNNGIKINTTDSVTSCGTGVGKNIKSNPISISGVTTNTVFRVHCD